MINKTQSDFKSLLMELLSPPLPSDEREEEIFEILDRLSPDPNYSDYIYHSDDFVLEDGTTDYDGLVEKIFSYEPIAL